MVSDGIIMLIHDSFIMKQHSFTGISNNVHELRSPVHYYSTISSDCF